MFMVIICWPSMREWGKKYCKRVKSSFPRPCGSLVCELPEKKTEQDLIARKHACSFLGKYGGVRIETETKGNSRSIFTAVWPPFENVTYCKGCSLLVMNNRCMMLHGLMYNQTV